ncbi:MAG: O-antigen ligase family protein [bacterium]|nr:O-antigen ligase family protein [bacterium]
MNKKNWVRLSLGLLLLTALVLPWQTKHILCSSVSDYWEISIYASTVLIILSILTLIPSGLIRLSQFKEMPRLWLYSVLVILIAGATSAFFSPYPLLSFYVLSLLVLSLVFFVFIQALPSSWKRGLALVFIVSLSLQALIGFYQFTTQLSFASSILGIASHSAADLGTAVIETADWRWLRAYGASSHPNAFGGLMAVGAIASLIFYIRSKQLNARIFFAFLYVLFLPAVLVSFSRAAIMALLVGLAAVIYENRKALRSSWKMTVTIVCLGIITTTAVLTLYFPLFAARSDMSNRLEQMSIADRGELNQRGLDNFLDYPILGTGLGASTIADSRRMPGLEAWHFQPAHNYWLLAAAEGGIFFVFGLSALWAFAYQKSRQRRLVSIFVVMFMLTLFDHWVLSLPLGSAWTFFLFALIW